MIKISKENAEIYAIQAVSWLIADEARAAAFFGETGADPSRLAQDIADANWLAASFGFIMMRDDWVVECAAHIGVPADEMLSIQARLAGGDIPNWT